MSSNSLAKRPWIVIVGGFLGSGKTSLILAAAGLLEQRGLRCAVILNDQGDE
jgi:G3E family GTPase